MEPMTGLEQVTFRYGRSTDRSFSAPDSNCASNACRSAMPSRPFRYLSLRAADTRSPNSSNPASRHGAKELVQRPFFVLCSSNRLFTSAVIPM